MHWVSQRQGDPLSCLLFNLAIEPLAEMLRISPKLEGYKVADIDDKIITSLFVDDTTVYLSSNNKYDDLIKILESWCKASSAKFNTGKTEIIPMGEEEYRSRLIHTRQLSWNDDPIPAHIRIVPDG